MKSDTGMLALAGTVASGFFIFSLMRGLKMREEKRRLAELLWYAGGPLLLAGVCLFWTSLGDQPVLVQRIILFTVGAAIGGCALLAAGEWLRPSTAAAQSSGGSVPTINNFGPSINTTNQSGGNNTINVAPTRLPFTTDLADQLIGRLPTGKPILLTSIGGNADQAIADQYQQYLQSKGFEVERTMIGMASPPPDHKITLGNPNNPKMVVIIAPSAQ